MKHLKQLLLTLATASAGTLGVMADAVSNYTLDFNKEFKTTEGFVPAFGWKHIVDKYTDPYNYSYVMTYYWYADRGVDGTGCFYASEQKAGDYYDYKVTNDYIITPLVSGQITMQVKAMNSKNFLEIYECDEAGKVVGELIGEKYTGFSDSEWTDVTINLDGMQRVALRAQYLYIDNFVAENADIPENRSMTIVSAEPSQTYGTIYWYEMENGKVDVDFTVTVKNVGEVTLQPDFSGYSISIINASTKEVYGVTKVPYTLAVGETSEPFHVTAEVDKEVFGYSGIKLSLRENLGETILARANQTYIAYEPKFVFRQQGKQNTTSDTNPLMFGMVTENSSKQYEIFSNGGAPLTVTNVEAPEGYTVSLQTPVTIQRGQTEQFDIVLDASTKGPKSGKIVFTYNDKEGNPATFEASVSGIVIAENAWTADFNNDSSTPQYPAGSVAEAGLNPAYKYVNNSYDNYLASYTNSDYAEKNNKFITPLLHAAAGDKLSYQVGKKEAGDNWTLKVYLSKDRKEWGEPVASFVSADFENDDWTDQILTFDEAGDWYVGFAIYGMKLDNIVGPAKVAVPHDLYIVEFKQPESVQSGLSLKPSVKIIALSDEEAANYTVKYYLDDEEIAQANSTALTAHAKNTKEFSVDTSVEVESTVTRQGRIEFEFTDGTKFSTETLPLAITNEPDFVFQGENASVGNWRPAEYKTPIDFGMTNTPGVSKTFNIMNFGTAPLTVKSISVPAGFSCDLSEAAVPAKSLQPIVISFSTEEAGNYSGNLEITYLDGNKEEQRFELALSGVMLDSSKWYASFDDGTSAGAYPAGTYAQKNISLSNQGSYSAPNVALNSNSDTDNIFISPLLRAASGEELSFRAKLYNSNWTDGAVEVYAAKSREALSDESARTTLGSFSGTAGEEDHKVTPDFNNFTVSLAEAGEWYLGFAISGRLYLDDISGLEVVAVPHDIIIEEVTYPETGMQNQSAIGSLKLRNLGLQNEEEGTLTLKVKVGEEIKETTLDKALLMAPHASTAATDVTFPVFSPRVGTYPVVVSVCDGDYEVVAEAGETTFVEETADGGRVVGVKSSYDNYPIHANYTNSESVMLYTPDMLGLNPGEKIASVAFRGYTTSDRMVNFRVAYELTDDQEQITPATTDLYDVSGMNLLVDVTDESYHWTPAGSAAEPVDLITLNFPEPLVYEAGKSLRIVVAMYGGRYTGQSYFDCTANVDVKHANRHTSDSYVVGNWNTLGAKLPVLYMNLVVDPRELSGSVLDKNDNPAAGATVSLVSADGDNVRYEGTVAADGSYNVPVIQTTRDYDVLVSWTNADGKRFEEFEDEISLADASLKRDYVLRPVVVLSADAAHAGAEEGAVVYFEPALEAGFNAVTFPVDITGEEFVQFFGEDSKVFEFTNDGGEGAVTAYFSTVESKSLQAGVPYLLHLTEPSAPFCLRSKDVVEELSVKQGLKVDFVPTAAPTALEEGMFVLAQENFQPLPAARRMVRAAGLPTYSAYLKAKAGENVNSVNFMLDTTVALEELEAEKVGNDLIYTLDGRRVKNPGKGIYIINGKAVLVK